MGACKINAKSQNAFQNAQKKSSGLGEDQVQDSLPIETQQGSRGVLLQQIKGNEWAQIQRVVGDLNKLPQVTFPDVFSNLVCGVKIQDNYSLPGDTGVYYDD